MLKPFDWDLLRSFLAVARSGKLTTAARRLKVDHSTLSRRIAALEFALKTKLFDKSLNGYALTLDGERLLAEAERVESTVIGIQNDIAAESTQVSGTVRIGTPDGFGTRFLAARIGALCARHPHLDVELVATPRSFSLSKREADIAIGLSNPHHGKLHTQKLTDYELGVYGAAEGAERFGDIADPQDLQRRPFVSYIDDLIFTPELDYLPHVARALAPRLKSSQPAGPGGSHSFRRGPWRPALLSRRWRSPSDQAIAPQSAVGAQFLHERSRGFARSRPPEGNHWLYCRHSPHRKSYISTKIRRRSHKNDKIPY